MMIMRKSRVESACGLVVILIALSVAVSGLFLTSGEYVPVVNDYSSYEINSQPPISDFIYPLANYSLVRSGTVIDLFERIGLQYFESGLEFNEGPNNLSHKDAYGFLEIHETPSTVVEYKSYQENGMRFQLAPDTGAIRKGKAIIVGSQDASGEFVMRGNSTAMLGDGEVTFMIPAGAGIIFRADPVNDFAIGSAVADGRVAAEMYLSQGSGWTYGEDIVEFDDVQLSTLAASEEVVDILVSGSAYKKAVVIHVAQPYLDYSSSDDIMVHLDGQEIDMGQGMTETLTDSGDEPVYYTQKTDSGFDIIVYIPEYSDSVITIVSAEADIGVDGLATLLAAIGIVGVAVVALIKID